eukprot:CAMPEP_0119268918 /NCGR_PEP_ID=MMETSP1329-20130426/6526_1 /TAXON_ID=114041 /ORGANISM="Genus nov. species nov., Strain RCC1024" /LENGTH=118 /DNA_ID=CAMNT_0007268903 /DNA_START=154 /DNA_END=507 /DNA_ORIENTATION=+
MARTSMYILAAMLLAACDALRPRATSRPRVVTMMLPGASTERISEDEARARSGWPHWNTKKKENASAPAPKGSAASRPKAYTLAYYQTEVERTARRDALLALAAATGRLCEAEGPAEA